MSTIDDRHDPARGAGSRRRPIASAMMIATWITVSRRRARNREPSPASTSSSATPSGVAKRDPIVELHVFNLDQFVSERSPTWIELERLRRPRGQPSEPARRRRRAPVRRVLPRDRGRSRARAPSLSRRSGRRASRTARAAQPARRVQLAERRAPACGSSSRTAIGVASASARVILAISFLCLAVPTLLGGYWAWRDPGPASGLVPSAVPVGDRNRARPARASA